MKFRHTLAASVALIPVAAGILWPFGGTLLSGLLHGWGGLAACLAATVHVIEPAGFVMSDSQFRRAGMDYLDRASLVNDASWEAYRAATAGPESFVSRARHLRPGKGVHTTFGQVGKSTTNNVYNTNNWDIPTLG